MVKMEEGRKDLGGKVSIFLVEESALVAMNARGRKQLRSPPSQEVQTDANS